MDHLQDSIPDLKFLGDAFFDLLTESLKLLVEVIVLCTDQFVLLLVEHVLILELVLIVLVHHLLRGILKIIYI